MEPDDLLQNSANGPYLVSINFSPRPHSLILESILILSTFLHAYLLSGIPNKILH